MDKNQALNFYYKRSSELYKLSCIAALLGWDQQVNLPPGSVIDRADQLEYISLALHSKQTDPEFVDSINLLYDFIDTLPIKDQVNIRESKRIIDIQIKLPSDFVAQLAQAEAIAYDVWTKARPQNDFASVKPHLEKIVDLNKQKCDYLGYKENPYDVLLDLYEPGATAAVIKPLLLNLAEELRLLIPRIADLFGDIQELNGDFPKPQQQNLCKMIAQKLGFSFETGRLDIAPHPFMTSLGSKDFRITTRYNESNFLQAFYGVIHESGHALYELGLPVEHKGTPMGEAVSLGIHESQSRLWENLIGRSKEFCNYLSKELKDYFPDEASKLNSDVLWRYADRVSPTLIRVEADEVTYSQHIVIRMLLEEQLIKSELAVCDLPDAWNNMYEKYLGIRPTDNKDGVLQDVHWYSGAIGYFPTYALGNLYNSMMLESIKEAIPNINYQVMNGEFSDILRWLRENVHKHGMRYRGLELIKNITGKELSSEAFIRYLKNKFEV